MRYYRCKCGKLESWSSMGSPDCYGCPDCKTTLAETPNLHEEPQPHAWDEEWRIVNPKTGESGPFRRCRKCHRSEPVPPNESVTPTEARAGRFGMTTGLEPITPEVQKRLDQSGRRVDVPSTRTGIGKRIAAVERQLMAHATTSCPMDGTQYCCDTLVVELKLLHSYLGVVERFGEMCDRLHDAVVRHNLGLGGEHVDDLVVEALDRAFAWVGQAHHLEWCKRVGYNPTTGSPVLELSEPCTCGLDDLRASRSVTTAGLSSHSISQGDGSNA